MFVSKITYQLHTEVYFNIAIPDSKNHYRQAYTTSNLLGKVSNFGVRAKYPIQMIQVQL